MCFVTLSPVRDSLGCVRARVPRDEESNGTGSLSFGWQRSFRRLFLIWFSSRGSFPPIFGRSLVPPGVFASWRGRDWCLPSDATEPNRRPNDAFRQARTPSTAILPTPMARTIRSPGLVLPPPPNKGCPPAMPPPVISVSWRRHEFWRQHRSQDGHRARPQRQQRRR